MRYALVCALVVGCGSSSDASQPIVTDANDTGISGDSAIAEASTDAARDAPTDAPLDTAPIDAPAETIDPAALSRAHQRADDALNAMLLHYWSETNAYLVETPGATKDAGYWIFAQAFDALLDGVERHRGAHYLGLVETFYQSQNAKGWSRNYYDDETWMTLALVRAYDLTKNDAYLSRAKSLFADVMKQWDTTCCGASKGGVWWDAAHTQKATASNMGPVIAALRLGARTGDASYLPWAQKTYDFWVKTMIDGTTHEVADHIDATTGAIVKWKFTYNEALTIGAAVELATATSSSDPLTKVAEPVAAFMRDDETKSGVLFDGDAAHCSGDCAAFKGIGARYLSLLTDASYRAVIDESAAAIWSTARTSETLFGPDWTASTTAPPIIGSDASATMALAAEAKLLGDAPIDPSASTDLQAEEATISGVGLEAAHAGFEGWGYVAGWNGPGSVTFTFVAPTDASHALEFRFAAGAGAAKRDVVVDGKTIASAHDFASTSSWDAFATTTITTALSAGEHTIALVFSAGSSSGFLNVDRLKVL